MPDWRKEISTRLTPLGLDPHREADIVEELAGHLEDRYQDALARGLDPGAAERLVRKEHLSQASLARALAAEPRPPRRAQPLGMTGGGWIRGLGSDLRSSARALRTNPGLVLVALITLALGIGANTAIFSVVNAALLRPLPFVDPDRLVTFWGTAPDKGLPVVNYPDAFYYNLKNRSRALESAEFYEQASVTLTGASGPAERLSAGAVSTGFFTMLGATPLQGRLFVPDDGKVGGPRPAIISHRLWQRRFGTTPGVLGQSVTINGVATTIVGIMPRGFDFPGRAEIWTPLQLDPQSLDCWCYNSIGRMAAGTTIPDVVRDLEQANFQFWVDREPGKTHTEPDPSRPGTIVRPLSIDLAGDFRPSVLILLGAVGLVLLIGCANLANLGLARAAARTREIAVRCALGASPARIRRQLLVESLVLSGVGAALGLGFAWLSTGLLSRIATARLSYLDHVSLDLRVAGFAAALGVITGLLFGVVPALTGARTELAPSLRDGNRGTSDAAKRRLNDGFVVAQLALSLILIVGAGLLLKSLGRLLSQDLGFDTSKIVVARLAPSWTLYREQPRIRRLVEQVRQVTSEVPGVESVGISSTAPFGRGNHQMEFVAQGHEPTGNQPIPVASIRRVTIGYFETVRTPLEAGRLFDHSDRDSSELVAIVDESLAKRYWPNGGAVGQHVAAGNVHQPTWLRIVGVVKSIRHQSLDGQIDPYIYVPMEQQPTWSLDIVVRSSQPIGALTKALGDAVRTIDPDLPVYDVHTLESAIDESVATRRFTNQVLLGFALAALLLAAIGIYGVMARNVAARVREFGVRLALGATPTEVRGLVLRAAVKLAVIGVGVGLLGAVGLTQFLRGMLFEVRPLDPTVLALAPLVLASVALAASYIPAHRATRSDPLAALRSE